MHPHAQAVFEAIIDEPEAERRSRARERCGADAVLLEDVLSLLQAHDRARSFLDGPTGGGEAETVGVSALHEGPGTRIGPYKLLEQIGEGGFGVVFLAEQEQPVRRRVALKVIKLGMDTRQVVARFEQERQALALMDHPNIARVLDAGATETGRPYFVMELVRGDPITEYCDRNNLSTEERLDLFIQTCHAVQHAHQKGIIHRDIKPSNVLVTVADSRPIPKVIDFGIAKATLSRLTEKTLFTEHRALIGTPEYMSPEQAERSGVDVDTRSDVYALGVLLYELLTGTTPFDAKTLRSAAFGEIQRIIREVEPPTPSTRLSTMGVDLAGVAAHRHTEPARLTRLVRGDLDWIVMKALEKDRTRRYGAATDLATDVQKHLAGIPVLAAPPSLSYRVTKFVRRHRVGVAAGALIATSLVLGIGGTSLGMVRALSAEGEQRRLTEAAESARAAEVVQRQLAETNAARADKVIAYIKEMLGSADPHAAPRGPDYTVREMLDDVARNVGIELHGQPEVESAIRVTLATAYSNLGCLDEASDHAQRALDLAREAASATDEATARFAVARTLHDRADYGGAERMYRDLLATGRTAQPKSVFAALSYLSDNLRHQRKFEDAEAVAREAVDECARRSPADEDDMMAALQSLGRVLNDQGRPVEARPMLESALDIARRRFAGDHPELASAMAALASAYISLGRYSLAEPLLVESLEMHRRMYPATSPRIAAALSWLGHLRTLRGHPAAAEPLLAEAVEILSRSRRIGDKELTAATELLANVRRDLGRAAEAEALYRQVLDVRRQHPEHGAELLGILNSLAVLLIDQEQFAEAAVLAEEAVAVSRAHPEWEGYASRRFFGPPLFTLGHAYSRLGRLDDAVAALRENAELHRQAIETGDFLPEDRGNLASAEALSGKLLIDLGRFAEAEPVLRECIELREQFPSYGPESGKHWALVNARGLLGLAILGQAEALDAVDPALALERRRESEPLIVECALWMAAHADPPKSLRPNRALEWTTRVREACERVVRLYESWDRVAPGQGYGQKAEDWRRRPGI